jgi:hypothetical protein
VDIATRRPRVEGQYDIRRGATAYAPIVGAFGALAVPAIVLVFALPSANTGASESEIIFVTGLLVIGMIGSLLGAFGLAAIGAEQDPTANLAPAVMFVAVPVATSLVAILSAFEVLAAIYIPESALLFALIALAGGVFGVIFNAFSISDSTGLGPSDPDAFDEWIKTQWLTDRRQSYWWAQVVAGVGVIPALVGGALRIANLTFRPTLMSVNLIIGAGVCVTLFGVLIGMLRTSHDFEGKQRGLRPWEAVSTNLAISVYTLALLVYLPR